MLLDTMEGVQLQMETDSGVNDGNYCIVSSGTINFFLQILYYLLGFCCKTEVAGSPKVMVARLEAAIGAAQLKPILQYQSMYHQHH